VSLQPSSDAAKTISSKILISLIVDADGSSGRDPKE
jgi:hypothetical protein